MFSYLALLIIASRTLAIVDAVATRTAAAFIHQDDGIYGSIVFHQWNSQGPVAVAVLFHNIKIGPKQRVDWNIHDEPVHYDQYDPDQRCGTEALKSVMKVKDKYVGELGTRHGMITGPRFAEVTYDWHISLYEDSDYNILGKSFVIRQGDSEADYRCATIESSPRHTLKPGIIPCQKINYADCLVGTARDDICVFRACSGYRKYWAMVDHTTRFCRQTIEKFPKPIRALKSNEGVVSCRHGNHSLLTPVDNPDEEHSF